MYIYTYASVFGGIQVNIQVYLFVHACKHEYVRKVEHKCTCKHVYVHVNM